MLSVCSKQRQLNTYFALCLVPAAAQAAGPPTAPPTAPRDVLEALEQRRAKYAEASAQAKAGGDDRKARMHDRIAKVSGPRWGSFTACVLNNSFVVPLCCVVGQTGIFYHKHFFPQKTTTKNK